jgi:hypothetical protein
MGTDVQENKKGGEEVRTRKGRHFGRLEIALSVSDCEERSRPQKARKPKFKKIVTVHNSPSVPPDHVGNHTG